MEPVQSLIRLLAACAKKLGMGDHSYIVGGAPRDYLLGHPVKDVDVVVETRGDRCAAMLAMAVARELGATTAPDVYGVCHVGPVPRTSVHFGADLVGQKVEIVASRSEKYDKTRRTGSHKPVSVAPGTILQDLSRRDFTINTLAWRLGDLGKGPEKAQVLDLLGRGLADLKMGTIRTPMDPEETFDEDPSRMLRAVRFAVKYGFSFHQGAYEAITKKAGELRRLPPEVVGDVFVDKILSMEPDKIIWALTLMGELELLFPTRSMVHSSRVRRKVVNDVTDAHVITQLARAGFEVGIKFQPGQVDRLHELSRTVKPAAFQELFERFRKPLDVQTFMDETGADGSRVGEALEKARALVLVGLDANELRTVLLREYA